MEKIQRLELVDHLFPALFSGDKIATLRWGEGDIEAGYLLYHATHNEDWKVLVWVTKVERGSLRYFAPFYQQTPEELCQSMRIHYPLIEIDSEVALIHHFTPHQTAEQKGLPADIWGQLILSAEGLKEGFNG